jgi:hypothetical protein
MGWRNISAERVVGYLGRLVRLEVARGSLVVKIKERVLFA